MVRVHPHPQMLPSMLTGQAVTLSRWKYEFESRWEYKNISNLFVYLKYFCYICIVSSFIILGIQGGCFHTILSWNGWRGKKCNIGEVSSLHIPVMGNVITVRFQEGDYGNPFVLNYMPKWGNGRPSRLKICRLQRRASSTLALGTKDKINFDNSKKFVIFVM